MITIGFQAKTSDIKSLTSLQKKGIIHKTFDGRYRFVVLFMPYWIGEMRK